MATYIQDYGKSHSVATPFLQYGQPQMAQQPQMVQQPYPSAYIPNATFQQPAYPVVVPKRSALSKIRSFIRKLWLVEVFAMLVGMSLLAVMALYLKMWQGASVLLNPGGAFRVLSIIQAL